MDIAIGDLRLTTGYGLYLFENIGNNTFEERTGSDNPLSTVGNTVLDREPTTADVNGDGFTDIVIASGFGGNVLLFYENDKNGSWMLKEGAENPFNVTYPILQTLNQASPLLMDVDDDSDFDLLIGDDDEIHMWRNDGNSTHMTLNYVDFNTEYSPFPTTVLSDFSWNGMDYSDIDNISFVVNLVEISSLLRMLAMIRMQTLQ